MRSPTRPPVRPATASPRAWASPRCTAPAGSRTRAFVIAGDAETEEGMTYEARNLAANLGMENLVVTLDYNGFGIDGPIFEVMPAPYVNHWFALGWNVIEADGHNPRELAYAYRLAAEGFGTGRPTVVIAHTRKGTDYGRLEGTGDSHGTPLPHAEYVDAMRKLGFAIPGVKGEVANDIAVVVEALGGRTSSTSPRACAPPRHRVVPEADLVERMETGAGRPPDARLHGHRAPGRAARRNSCSRRARRSPRARRPRRGSPGR